MYVLLIPLLFCTIFLESVWIHIPLTLIVLLVMAIYLKKEWVLFVALLAGIFLDSVSFRPLGVSSIYFCCCLLLIFLYEKKFEIQTVAFVAGATAIATLGYLLLFGFGNIIFQLAASVAIAVGIYGGVIGWKTYVQRS